MKCKTIKKETEYTCDDVNGIKYCKTIIKEEIICVPSGKDAQSRLNEVILGLAKGWARFKK